MRLPQKSGLIDKAAVGMELAGDEYIDPADGLIHCKKCGGQRQTVVPCFGKSGYFMPRCICQCQREAEESSARLLKNGSAAWSVSNAERHRACKTVICTTTHFPMTTAKIP